MPQIINTNIASLTAQRNLNTSQNSLNTSLQRLSSGLRINSAKDDAAGLAITERFTSQIRGLNQAQRNANDGISLAQTAEGDLAQITNNLQRIRELAVQSANATNSASDREALQLEVSQLVSEIDRVASTSAFNGVNLLDGSFTSQDFQVGANAGETVQIASISSSRTSVLGQNSVAAFTGNTAGITANGLSSGDLTINTVDIAAGGNITADALEIANAITASSDSVTATATNTQTIGFAAITGDVADPTDTNLGSFSAVLAEGAGVSTASFSIDGQEVFSGTSSGVDDAGLISGSDIDGALSVFDGNADGNFTLNGVDYSYVGTAASGGANLTISRLDGEDMTVELTSTNATDVNGFANQIERAAATVVTNGTPAVPVNYTLSLDGQGLDLSPYYDGGADITISQADLVGAINSVSGFSAATNGASIDITKTDGSNFTITQGGTDTTVDNEGLTGITATETRRGAISSITSTGEDLVIGGNNVGYAGLSGQAATTTAVITGGTGVGSIDISGAPGAQAAIETADRALGTINTSRASLGAIQNRFESVVSSIQTTSENLSAARSRIRDTDFAEETAALTRSQILQQAGVSILSQANSLPQNVLALLQ